MNTNKANPTPMIFNAAGMLVGYTPAPWTAEDLARMAEEEAEAARESAERRAYLAWMDAHVAFDIRD